MARSYPAEFRRKVPDLIEAGQPVAEVAHRIIVRQTFRRRTDAGRAGHVGDAGRGPQDIHGERGGLFHKQAFPFQKMYSSRSCTS